MGSRDAERRRRALRQARAHAARRAGELEAALGRARVHLACPPLVLEPEHINQLVATHKVVWTAARLTPASDDTRVILDAAVDEIAEWLRTWNGAQGRSPAAQGLLDCYNTDVVPRLQRLEVRLAEALHQPSLTDLNQIPPEYRP